MDTQTPKTIEEILEGYESNNVMVDYDQYERMWPLGCIEQAFEEYRNQPAPIGNELISAYEDYIKLLENELTDGASLATLHGWKSTRYDKGVAMRDKIANLKSAQPIPQEEVFEQKDMTGEKCDCGGYFMETHQLDDLKAVLHCSKCLIEINRYTSIRKNKPQEEGLEDGRKDFYLWYYAQSQPLDANIIYDHFLRYFKPQWQKQQQPLVDEKVRMLKKALIRMVAEFDTKTPTIPSQEKAVKQANEVLNSLD